MARKGKEVQLQREVETQEEWEDMLSKEGLCVIDVFQEWCGPVGAMLGTFRRIKNEIGDSLMKFIIAKADTIDALEKYRGRCEPCFLFYAGGVLVAVIRGANAPLILRTITEQLAQEHKVLDGQAERKEVKDQLIAQLDARERQREEEEEEEEAMRMTFQGEIIEFGDDLDLDDTEPVKEVTVVIIKPDAVQSGKSKEILAEMDKRGIQILRQEERQLTEEEVKNVYTHLQDETYFNDLITFMTSSPSIVLAITKGKTGQNIIKEFRELIGPTAVEDAKEAAPDSLRAKFGQEKYMNAVHGSDSSDTAARELAFFFPDFAAPKVESTQLQRTLALIRPDAYKNSKDAILAKIRESGFKVAMEKEIQLTKEQAEEFYREHEGQEYFEELTTRMSCGPLLALGLAREEAIAGWRDMLGPTKVEEAKEQQPESLRAMFSEDGAQVNMLHGSDSVETAKKEIEFFFPIEQTVAMIKPDAIGTKDQIITKIHEAGFRIAARKETKLTREIAEEFYSEHVDKPYYDELVEHMTSGKTYLMVLSREGAVDGWRSLIGPTDPAKAKELDVETIDQSIRGQFGTDTLRNAVHGSSTADQAKAMISKIFDEQEEAISEQQQVSYEPAPEYDDQEASHDEQQVEEQEQVDKTEEAQDEKKPVEDQTPEQTSEAQKSEAEVTPEQQAETEEEKVKSPEPQSQDTQEAQPAEQATEDQTEKEETEQKTTEPEQAPAEQQAEATEEPAKTKEEPAKAEEEPAKTEEVPAKMEEVPAKMEEEPVKQEEEPAKTEEEPVKATEEQTKTEEEPAKTDEAKAEAKAEETKQEEAVEQKTEDTSEQKKEETPAEGGQ